MKWVCHKIIMLTSGVTMLVTDVAAPFGQATLPLSRPRWIFSLLVLKLLENKLELGPFNGVRDDWFIAKSHLSLFLLLFPHPNPLQNLRHPVDCRPRIYIAPSPSPLIKVYDIPALLPDHRPLPQVQPLVRQGGAGPKDYPIVPVEGSSVAHEAEEEGLGRWGRRTAEEAEEGGGGVAGGGGRRRGPEGWGGGRWRGRSRPRSRRRRRRGRR